MGLRVALSSSAVCPIQQSQTSIVARRWRATSARRAHATALTIAGPDDVEGLADRLASLLKAGPARRAQMGAELRQATAAAHSLEGLMDRLVGALGEASRR